MINEKQINTLEDIANKCELDLLKTLNSITHKAIQYAGRDSHNKTFSPTTAQYDRAVDIVQLYCVKNYNYCQEQ